MKDFQADIRFAVRRLLSKPLFLLVCVVTLALGIGANTAIFGVVYHVLLRPLPYPEPDRIVRMLLETSMAGGRRLPGLSLDAFREWRESNTVFSGLAAFQDHTTTLDDREPAVEMTGLRATVDFFQVLGGQAALGGVFLESHERRGNERVIVLSQRAWKSYFAGDPGIVGESVSLEGVPHTVIGVMPSDFAFPDDETEYWIPMLVGPAQRQANVRRVMVLPVLARLKPNVSIEQAEAEGRSLWAELERQGLGMGRSRRGQTELRLETLLEQIVGPVRTPLWILLAAVGLLLLIACSNVANLLLARGAERQSELAVRAALGAGGGRLLRLVLTESVMLALLGGAAGISVALAGVRLMRVYGMGLIPRVETVSLDWRVLLFTAGLSTAAGLVFGMIPALQYRRLDLTSALKEGVEQTPARGLPPALRQASLRGGFVVTQIALAVVLVVAAALLASSFLSLSRVDPGYDYQGVAAMEIQLPGYRYASGESRADFYQRLLERVRSRPGVESAGIVNFLPMAPARINLSFQIAGRPAEPEGDEPPSASVRVVTPGYFRTMRTEILRGRDFLPSDREGARDVVIINQAFADRHFPDEEPVGQSISFGEIVGVVENIRNEGLQVRPDPEFYFPLAQLRARMAMMARRASLAVRSQGSSEDLVPQLHAEVRAIDPALPQFEVALLEERIDREVARPRLLSGLMGSFSALALALALIGLYGVTSYAVARRTRETGIRMALGAESADILRLVIREGMALALIGTVLGLAAALALSRVLESLLFGVEPTDPATFVAVPLALLLVMLPATYLPARRAAGLDPCKSLRVG